MPDTDRIGMPLKVQRLDLLVRHEDLLLSGFQYFLSANNYITVKNDSDNTLPTPAGFKDFRLLLYGAKRRYETVLLSVSPHGRPYLVRQ